MLHQWLFRLGSLFRSREVEADFDEEMRYHFDREIERNLQRGMPKEEARRAARRAFGDPARMKEEARESWRWMWLDELARDIGYALRILRRTPGFTAVVVITLALGIGANTAVFSVVRSVLLRPLPYPDDDRLAVLLIRAPRFHFEDFPSSPPEYVGYRDHSRSWEHLAASDLRAATVTGDGDPERISVAYTTWNLFPTLGVQPHVGRAFTHGEDQAGSNGVAVLSHGFWMSRYGGDRSVLGKTIRLDGIERTIVGVMPAEFAHPATDVRVWLPLALTAEELQQRGNHSLWIVGRLRPGVTLDAAGAELNALTARFVGDAAFRFHDWHPAYLRALRTDIVGDVSRTLWVMLGAVALVLAIACANVANLVLVRAESRAREMSLRSALGAGRRRLVSQLLTESVVMAVAGGLAGVALAYLGVDALRAVAPADLPRLDEISVDTTVLLFTMIITLGAGMLFGLAPALLVGRANLQGMLREEGRGGTTGRGRVRLRQLLVVSETALAIVLLVAAGLLIQSFRRITSVDPGFRAEGVLTARITIPSVTYPDDADVVAFYEALLPRIASLPGVTAAGAAGVAPLTDRSITTDIEVEGWTGAPDAPRPTADIQPVTPGYFSAMSIPLLAGRTFEERDRMDAPLVAMVSEALAREYWPGRNAIGGRIRFDYGDAPFAEVVGIVPDVRQERLDEPAPRGTLYFVHAQAPRAWVAPRGMALTVRTALETASLTSAIRREVHGLDPALALYQIRTMEQVVADTTATRRFSMVLQLVFALVALTLAAVGLYGVLAFAVARRTREIGIRMALGARRGEIQGMVVRQGMGLVAVAVVLGVMGALVTGRLLTSLLYGVSPSDPLTYATVVGVLLVVAFMACVIPARRASGVAPCVALRGE